MINENSLFKQNSFILEKVLLQYRTEGAELEKKFEPEIQQAINNILNYVKIDSLESFKECMKNRNEFPLGIIMNKFVMKYFSGQELDVTIDSGGESGHCVTFDPYSSFNEEFDEENIPYAAKNAIDNLVGESQKERVTGITWSSGGIMSRFGNKGDTPHNGLWVSSQQRGTGLGYGLYRLQEKIFGEIKQEEAPSLSLLKLFFRLGFVPKAALNPSNGKILEDCNIDELIKEYLEKKEEHLDFHIYLERK